MKLNTVYNSMMDKHASIQYDMMQKEALSLKDMTRGIGRAARKGARKLRDTGVSMRRGIRDTGVKVRRGVEDAGTFVARLFDRVRGKNQGAIGRAKYIAEDAARGVGRRVEDARTAASDFVQDAKRLGADMAQEGRIRWYQTYDDAADAMQGVGSRIRSSLSGPRTRAAIGYGAAGLGGAAGGYAVNELIDEFSE